MSDVHAGYDPIGTKCLGKAQPGTVALRDAMHARWNHPSDGIYNCRNVRGGTTKSAHAEGRAYDDEETNEADGRAIAAFLVEHNAALGIQCVIWWDRIWSYQVGHWHDYHGTDNHHGHIHVEQNWSGAKHLTRAAADFVIGAALVVRGEAVIHAHVMEDDDMPYLVRNEDNDLWFVIDGNTRRRVSGLNKRKETVQELRNKGVRDAGNVSTGYLTDATTPLTNDD